MKHADYLKSANLKWSECHVKKTTKRQTIVFKTEHWKLKTEQHEPNKNGGYITRALKGWPDPALNVAPAVLFIIRSANYKISQSNAKVLVILVTF